METQAKPRLAETRGQRWEATAAVLERHLERRQAWVLTLWSLAYFAGTALRAQAKPFWYDEILTLLEARQPTLPAAMRALGDVDWMPPASHFTFYLTDKLVGHGEVAFRLPAMIGFWVFCLCLFFFARRRLGMYLALVALLVPFATSFYIYALEARSYGLMLGFAGIALVSWQAATERAERTWPLVGLAIGIGGAAALQYWAVLLYLPLAGAEAFRGFQQRRVDWPIWVAFTAGAVPLISSAFHVLHGFRAWAPWRRTQLQDYMLYYTGSGSPNRSRLALAAAVLFAVYFFSRWIKRKSGVAAAAAIPGREWLAAALFLLIPAAAISITLVLQLQFSDRYICLVVTGMALLVCFMAARVADQSCALRLVLALLALVPFSLMMARDGAFRNPLLRRPALEAALERAPVVVDKDIVAYLPLWYYAPDRLKPRLLFVWRGPTPRAPMQGPFLAEFPKVGVPVVAYGSFATPGAEVLIYGNRSGDLQKAIIADGGTLTITGSEGRNLLIQARFQGETR